MFGRHYGFHSGPAQEVLLVLAPLLPLTQPQDSQDWCRAYGEFTRGTPSGQDEGGAGMEQITLGKAINPPQPISLAARISWGCIVISLRGDANLSDLSLSAYQISINRDTTLPRLFKKCRHFQLTLILSSSWRVGHVPGILATSPTMCPPVCSNLMPCLSSIVEFMAFLFLPSSPCYPLATVTMAISAYDIALLGGYWPCWSGLTRNSLVTLRFDTLGVQTAQRHLTTRTLPLTALAVVWIKS